MAGREDREMTSERATRTTREAVEVLNRNFHRQRNNWYVSTTTDGRDDLVCCEDPYEWFTPFEAVAIAERYLGRACGQAAR